MKTLECRKIDRCRVCGNKRLSRVLSLGRLYVSDFVTERSAAAADKYPLDLVLCDPTKGGCGLLQLAHSVNPARMYRFYYYRSGANRIMRRALRDITRSIESRQRLRPGDSVLDIGCNDGTLLRSYKAGSIKRLGFDPAKNLVGYARAGTTKIVNDYFNLKAFRDNFGGRKLRAVTSIAMFYDLDRPNRFVSDIKSVLAPGGLWVLQMSYLPLMLKTNAFDNICHEHLEYYSMLSLKALLDRHALSAVDVEENDVNGGSFRVYIRHAADAESAPKAGLERVRKMLAAEKRARLDKLSTYHAFAKRVRGLRSRLVRFIRQERSRGKSIAVYGASTKGNTLLQYYGLDHRSILVAAERNPDKYGKMTIGTRIPIESEESVRARRPDYFLVLPWHFLKGFVAQEKGFLRRGGRFIVPLPEFRVIGYNSKVI